MGARAERPGSSSSLWLKLENLQPINSFKLRGAANAVAMLSAEARGRVRGPASGRGYLPGRYGTIVEMM